MKKATDRKPPKGWDANDLESIEILNSALTATFSNAVSAIQDHGHFHSAHEAYGVLLEEVDEFWEEVRKKKQMRNKAAMRQELLQIAAVAIKTIVSLKLTYLEEPKSQM